MTSDDLKITLAEILGTLEAPSIQQLTLYIPNKDRNGRLVRNLKRWLEEAQGVLTKIGGGSTSLPPADGTWFNPESDQTVWEKTRIVYTYVNPDDFENNADLLREFLHRFGRETNQGEVVFEFDGRFFKIREYDPKKRTKKRKKDEKVNKR